jgi:hypothetical protein
MAKRGEYKKNAKPESVRKREFNSRPEQKKRRAERNAARALMERKGRVRKGDGKDVDHANHKTSDKSSKNLRVMSKSKNRAKNQHSSSYKRGKK